MYPTSQYLCSLAPLIDVQVPGNKSYILSLRFRPVGSAPAGEEKGDRRQKEEAGKKVNLSEPFDFDSLVEEASEEPPRNVSEAEELFSLPAEVRGHLTLVSESRHYHKAVFYMKCLFVPFVIAALGELKLPSSNPH